MPSYRQAGRRYKVKTGAGGVATISSGVLFAVALDEFF
jgi:hypothetical protein